MLNELIHEFFFCYFNYMSQKSNIYHLKLDIH